MDSLDASEEGTDNFDKTRGSIEVEMGPGLMVISLDSVDPIPPVDSSSAAFFNGHTLDPSTSKGLSSRESELGGAKNENSSDALRREKRRGATRRRMPDFMRFF